MSAVLVARELSAAYGNRTLFTGLDLTVGPGDVVGLVGPNGAGKSTLLEILAGSAAPEGGAVTLAPASSPSGYLRQEREPDDTETVRECLHRRTGVAAATTAMDAAAHELSRSADGADDRYAAALEAWLALGGADLDDRVAAVVSDLGMALDLDLATSALSGGQAARVGLAALLLSRYDMYLLDEPTNDLDVDGLELLEDFVQSQRCGIVVVSHDREFLSRTATAVVEIDVSLQRVTTYGGGYDAYLEERSVARRHAREAYDDYAARREALLARARTQRAWMEKGVRNARRKATDNDKLVRSFRAEARRSRPPRRGRPSG